MRIPINNSILIFKEHTIKKNTPWCDIISKPMTTEHYFCCNNHQLLQFKPCQSLAVQLFTTHTGGHLANSRLFWAISEISTSSACGQHRLFPLDSAFFSSKNSLLSSGSHLQLKTSQLCASNKITFSSRKKKSFGRRLE